MNLRLENNNLLFENQLGFRQGKGTDQAIAKTTNTIKNTLEKKREAFYTIDHNILLNKLKNIGITRPALDLFISYYSGRKQLVKINKKNNSDEMKIKFRVPQGTTISPINS